MEARCIQHELDHLEGKLCIDYGKTTDSGGEEDLLKAMVESNTRLNLIRKAWKPYADIEIQGPGVKKIIKIGTSVKKYD